MSKDEMRILWIGEGFIFKKLETFAILLTQYIEKFTIQLWKVAVSLTQSSDVTVDDSKELNAGNNRKRHHIGAGFLQTKLLF